MIDIVRPHTNGTDPSPVDRVRHELLLRPRRWLVTGAAGFIGSNLAETLLRMGQEVVGLDNFSTGHRRNVDAVVEAAGDASRNYWFVEGDIRDLDTCREVMRGVDVVLHQAAIGSVPRSIDDPLRTHASNVNGTVNMLEAARGSGVRRFVYACSSSTYGDHPGLPKVEDAIGRPLSPYAASKRVGEIYAGVYQRTYGLETVGLRYFNVFGRRQDPEGPYAAVIPKWISLLLTGERCEIYGDGETSRDFCYVDNVIQANLLAALAPSPATDAIYNVACGSRTTLNQLYRMVRDGLVRWDPSVAGCEPVYREFRPGDVRHSLADVALARERLGYAPTHGVREGLEAALEWYVGHLAPWAVAADASDRRGASVGVVVQELTAPVVSGASRALAPGGSRLRARVRLAVRLAGRPGSTWRGARAAFRTPSCLHGRALQELLGLHETGAGEAPHVASPPPLPPEWKASQRAAYVVLRRLARLPGRRWRDTCLYRSVASCLILRDLGVPAHVRLGVRRPGTKDLLPAHAWAVAGDRPVTPVGADLVPLRPAPAARRPERHMAAAGDGR